MNMRHFPDSDAGTWIRWLSQVIILPVIVYVLLTQVDHDRRLAVIEANRFTSRDASDLQLAVAAKDAELLSLINEVRRGNAVHEERIVAMIDDLRELRSRVARAHDNSIRSQPQ